MATSISTLKSWFTTGKFPTQAQFWAWLDSFRHKDESIPVNEIEGLNELLDLKADLEALNNHINDINPHADLFESKADLVAGKVPASQLPSYVDDVLEFPTLTACPTVGEFNKIYVITTGVDANKQFRWSGTSYIELTSGSAVWGSISGSVSNQTDLIALLNAKQNAINALANRLLLYTQSGIIESVIRQIENKIGIGINPIYDFDVAGTIRAGQELIVGTYISTESIKNILSDNALIELLTTGARISRNVNDANAALTVKNINSQSIGPIQAWQNHTGNVMILNKNGSLQIGSAGMSPSALYQMNSIDKGFLPPRMTEAQRNAIQSPEVGLMIFNTSLQTIDVYTTSGWSHL